MSELSKRWRELPQIEQDQWKSKHLMPAAGPKSQKGKLHENLQDQLMKM